MTTVARSTALMAAGTMLSRLTGFGRVVALAYAFGFTRLTDTYTLANTTPNIVYELILGGVLSATLIPVFVDLLNRGRTGEDHGEDNDDEAWRGISAVVTAATVTAVAVSALFALAAPLIIRLYTLGKEGGAADDQRAVATVLLVLFAPQVALYGLITMVTALANARRRFGAPMFAPVANNLLVIATLLAVPHVADDLSLAAMRHDTGALMLLGLGTTAGVAAQAVVQLLALRGAGIRLRPSWNLRHPAVARVVRLSGWTFGFAVANQLSLYVVLVLANRGAAGDVTAYQAGHIFFLLPHGVFSVSIMTALLPDLAERWSGRDLDGFRRRVSMGLRTIAFVLVPAALGYLLLAEPIVRVALEHGAFGAADTQTTSDVLALFALGLPGFSIYLMLMRAYQAMQDTRSMFVLYAVENAVNVVLALALYPSLGVQGLALAYALAYVGGTAVALVHLRRRLGGLDGANLAAGLVRTLVAAAAMGVVVAGATAVVDGPLLTVGIAVPLGVAVYGLVARRLGIGELDTVLRTGRRSA